MSLNYRLTAFTACILQIRTHTREQISDDFVSRSLVLLVAVLMVKISAF